MIEKHTLSAHQNRAHEENEEKRKFIVSLNINFSVIWDHKNYWVLMYGYCMVSLQDAIKIWFLNYGILYFNMVGFLLSLSLTLSFLCL